MRKGLAEHHAEHHAARGQESERAPFSGRALLKP